MKKRGWKLLLSVFAVLFCLFFTNRADAAMQDSAAVQEEINSESVLEDGEGGTTEEQETTSEAAVSSFSLQRSYYPWRYQNDSWYYYAPDGTMVTGWVDYDKNTYYLQGDGRMAVGWKKINEIWYYFRSWGGMVKNSFFEYDRNTYYVNEKGEMAAGWKKINGIWYYFRSWGGMVKNSFFEYDRNTYYVNEKGEMAAGWKKINGIWYYFRSWGGMVKNSFFDYDHNTYYVNEKGEMAVGWKKINGIWYYFRSWGGMIKNSFFEYDRNTYYVNEKGEMAVGWKKINGIWHYFYSWGGMIKNRFFEYDHNTYYVNEKGEMLSGICEIHGDLYAFYPWGGMIKNHWLDEKKQLTGENPQLGFYYLGSDGKMVRDFYFLSERDGKPYYYSFDSSGACILGSDQYVKAKDSVNGKYYTMEHQYFTDPSVSDRDFMAAICYAEAGIQKKTGMTAVAMVIRNRMLAKNASLKTVIYQQQQFEPARSGSLTRYLQAIDKGDSSVTKWIQNSGAYEAADESGSIMNAYLANGTKRVISGFGDTREDFDYLYFMTPAAFLKLNLDEEKCETYTYTYHWNSDGISREDSHVFFRKWVKKPETQDSNSLTKEQ